MERALLVVIQLESDKKRWPLEDIAFELEELVVSSGTEAVDTITCIRHKPTPNFFIGRGKIEEIADLSQELEVDTVIFSHDLSGTQQRNAEEVIGKKTIDRTQLILDIFARHAKTPEGKMQVELAQLQYLLPRLIGKGVILSRLGGGIGTRGPGEQKLEVDRRKIRKRIDTLKDELAHLSVHRKVLRKRRKENAIPSIALVGYTNAGKSTLLNTLTGAYQIVADSLFTTLDPLSRNIDLANGEQVIISDTVGFLNNLPHHLIEAFKATLEEVVEADLLLHVIDISNPLAHEHAKAVFSVLKELKVDQKPIVTVLNKIDLIEERAGLDYYINDFDNAILVSAKTRENIDLLLKRVENNFQDRMATLYVLLSHSRMDLVDLFYRQGKVHDIEYSAEGIKIRVSLPKIISHKLINNKEIAEIY
ncbi:MAG: GTPase HflX [Candidatus Omnitrophica bacterium]|nr:GTPase HflX [Candidatus Omnitrophota bacterium]